MTTNIDLETQKPEGPFVLMTFCGDTFLFDDRHEVIKINGKAKESGVKRNYFESDLGEGKAKYWTLNINEAQKFETIDQATEQLSKLSRPHLIKVRRLASLSKQGQPKIINFDPNMTLCGHIAKQVVSMTFGLWEYRGTFEVEVCGNLTGLDVIRSAIETLYESLPYTELPFDKGGYATITLGELISDDEDQRGKEWLSEMLISAEIISIEDAGTW